MLFLRNLRLAAPLISLVGSGRGQDSSPSTTTGGDATKTKATAPAVQPTCESRTVNYITHTLPQLCLTTLPSSIAPSTSSVAVSQTASTAVESAGAGETASAKEDGAEDEEHELDSDGNDLSTGAFMSFEEWKEMMLRKSGQENLENRPRKSQEGRGEPLGEDYGTIGEEGEISLDFDAYSDKISEITSAGKPPQKDNGGEESAVEKVSYDEGLGHVHRSKDAGKTCKERFSYASFDAGATVLKTSPGAKNPKAILVENKDSYMLMECGTQNKFFIAELSDDILVDTVVLANFEFFSSMIRQFRVSVSDRYPVKLEKWKILGEYTARNSRDIQPFLIENPQIWARYIRIEILSHYGKEFYCPLSLLRVHGTRMLDSWKEADLNDMENEFEPEEEAAQIAEPPEEPVELVEVLVEESQVQEPVPVNKEVYEMQQSTFKPFWDASYFQYSLQRSSTCGLDEQPTTLPQIQSEAESRSPDAAGAKPKLGVPAEVTGTAASTSSTPSVRNASATESVTSVLSSSSEHSHASPSNDTTSSLVATSAPSSATTTGQSSANKQTTSTTNVSIKPTATSKSKTAASTSLRPPSHKSATSKVSNGTTVRNKTATATSSSASASPTVQDSFFKQLTKRLQNLESNTTLSLQYIESQSKFLQEALAKLERRHASKVDLFLDSLNKTVMTELREVRSQYDQIWQSVVIALESQEKKLEHENLALSTRVGLLADEVVFQKRMAIVQSVLLLGCLVLVVFGRGMGSAGLELYYPSQFQGSFSRLASPLYPTTPKRLGRGAAQHRGSSIREAVEDPNLATPNRGLVSDSDTNATPPRPPVGHSLTPELRPQIQRHLSLPENPRPSPSRAISENTGIDLYQPPTPASLDAGYDSEPPHTSSSPRADYFSPQTNGNYANGGEDMPAEKTPLSNQNQQVFRLPTPSSDVDENINNEIGQPPRNLTRMPMSATAGVKPLPALPEDSD